VDLGLDWRNDLLGLETVVSSGMSIRDWVGSWKTREIYMFKVGDAVILNDVDQPCGKLVAIVVKDDGTHYHCEYLNADPRFDHYSKPPMRAGRLERATKLEDFGVVLCVADGKYWCDQIGESAAKYPDGQARQWQEFGGRMMHRARPHLATILWDVGNMLLR
jgi:hypothetical protein